VESIKRLAIILLIVLSLSGCSNSEAKLIQEENLQLKQHVKSLESERDDMKRRLERLQSIENKDTKVPSIMYSNYEQKLRLVMKETDLHIYFGNNAPVVNKIMPRTAVNVLDAGMVEGEEMWLYVEMPVYDIPAYYKGWIRESDTLELTAQNKKEAYDSIVIQEGIKVFNCEKVQDIPTAPTEITGHDVGARIERVENGYAYVFSAGGWTFWVKEEDITYAYDMLND